MNGPAAVTAAGMEPRPYPRPVFARPGVRHALRLLPVLWAICAAPAAAQWAPSRELSFRVSLSRDSVLVGDPIDLEISASGPEGARLILPESADSLGPLAVLETGAVRQRGRGGLVQLERRDRVTAFRTGGLTLPALPLLWVSDDGDTAVAWSSPVDLAVGSLLEEGAGLQDLRDLRGVVPLARPTWWLWVLIAAGAALLLWLLLRLVSRLSRRSIPQILRPPDPPLPPEIAFERGYRALQSKRLPEAGRIKEFYGEISLLLRAYMEGRFMIPAVEETRTELMSRARRIESLSSDRLRDLDEWLAEGDLVKFAKLDRLLDEARDYGERAAEWVCGTTPPPSSSAAGREEE